jgi:23S rRNA (pseudouridine1915-N3)-methyltransferase
LKIIIAAAGRFRTGPEKVLYQKYVDRLPWSLSLFEVDEKHIKDVKKRRHNEAQKLEKVIPRASTIIALDETGVSLSSEGLAKKLAIWQDQGVRDLVFLIGGAAGHSPDLLKRADLVLSLGAMTWPHILVRVMLAEQLYRASTLISGHPYHRA